MWWDQMPWSSFFECWVLSQLFPLSFFTFIKRLFIFFFLFFKGSLVPLHFLPLEWYHPHAYLRLLMFLPPILIPACNSSSLAFLMMCSENRLNKQGDSRQPCHTPFSISCSIQDSNLLLLDPHAISQETGKLFKRVPWFVMIHTIKDFSVVDETEVDVFLEFPCFL